MLCGGQNGISKPTQDSYMLCGGQKALSVPLQVVKAHYQRLYGTNTRNTSIAVVNTGFPSLYRLPTQFAAVKMHSPSLCRLPKRFVVKTYEVGGHLVSFTH